MLISNFKDKDGFFIKDGDIVVIDGQKAKSIVRYVSMLRQWGLKDEGVDSFMFSSMPDVDENGCIQTLKVIGNINDPPNF